MPMFLFRNIVSMLSAYDSPSHAIVTKLAESGTLSSKLDISLSNEVTLQYSKHIAAGISYIHSKGISHLDIKCDNILIDKSNIAMLVDFGLAMPFTGHDEVIIGRGDIAVVRIG